MRISSDPLRIPVPAARLVLSTALLFFLAATAGAQPQRKEETTKGDPFLHTRVTFSFGDDNVLVDAGETRKQSPMAWFGACDAAKAGLGTDSSDCGQNRTDLVLYKRLKLSPFFQPEAALAVTLDVVDGDLQDSGSYVRTNFFMDDRHETVWALTFFPVDADLLRLGYYWDVSWGGTDAFPKNYRNGYAPGVKYDLDMRYWHLFLGAKAAKIRSPEEDTLANPGGNTIKNVERTFYGLLGGFGFDVMDTGLRFEVNGGFFHKGANQRMNVLGKPIYSGGVSARVSYQTGLEIGRQIDIRIHQQDPVRDMLFQKEKYRPGDVSVAAQAEGSFLVQTLEDPDRVDSTKNEMSFMAHAGFALKYDFLRVFLHFVYRDLTAITFDTPGFVPYQALGENADVSPEVSGSVGIDYSFQPFDITTGLSFTVLKPATYTGTAQLGSTSGPVDQGLRKMVIRGPHSGDWDVLPTGHDERAVFILRADVKWSYYEAFAVIASIYYGRDENSTQVIQDDQGYNFRQFDEPNAVGFTIMSQVRF